MGRTLLATVEAAQPPAAQVGRVSLPEVLGCVQVNTDKNYAAKTEFETKVRHPDDGSA